MSDDKRTADQREENPEERAFTGHPDHPPATPDQPLEGNQALLDGEEEEEAEGEEAEPPPG